MGMQQMIHAAVLQAIAQTPRYAPTRSPQVVGLDGVGRLVFVP